MAPFFYHPRMLDYHFGPGHPFIPEKLRRTVLLCEAFGFEPNDPGLAEPQDVLRVHDGDYLEAVRALSRGKQPKDGHWGFGVPDNPPFAGMYEIALGVAGGSVAAARAVGDGRRVAFNFGGGLHHARRNYASGFCIFNDCAMACSILRESFARVAYVDIDLHHGDGVQFIFYDDPSVLTCSIHESGRTLYPGTGFVSETGESFTSWNVPMEAGTTGDIWLDALRRGILPALQAFEPGALVIQLGADPHSKDPLGHLNVSVQHWQEAVQELGTLGLPTVALGGGGYNVDNVPRMWLAAALTLTAQPVPEKLPEFAWEWGVREVFDQAVPIGQGKGHAERVVAKLAEHLEEAKPLWARLPR